LGMKRIYKKNRRNKEKRSKQAFHNSSQPEE